MLACWHVGMTRREWTGGVASQALMLLTTLARSLAAWQPGTTGVARGPFGTETSGWRRAVWLERQRQVSLA